ncbi:hypothetical protein NDI43_27040 [Microcoleus vaginatus GB2-A3]|uniref:hypothetical protein n=1 Tax=Microcoleus TaxID=44471 RepID=UPI002FCEC07C
MTPRQRGDRLAGTVSRLALARMAKCSDLGRCGGFWGDWMAGTGTAGTIAPQARLHSRNSRTLTTVGALAWWQGRSGGTVGAVARLYGLDIKSLHQK